MYPPPAGEDHGRDVFSTASDQFQTTKSVFVGVGAVARSWAAPSKKTPGRPPKAGQEA